MHRFEMVGSAQPLVAASAEMPRPAGREVLLRVLAAGVCHTDLHLSDGYFDLGRGKRIALADRGIRLPHTLGHENVGEVVALGPEARGLQIGDRVLVYPWIGCDACAQCAAGAGHLCAAPRFIGVFRPGGFSDHLLVPDARYLFALGDLPATAAAPLACSGLTAYSALMKVREAAMGGPIVIIGAGGLGLMCLSMLALLVAPGAIVIEPNPAKRNAALEMGALAALGTDAEDSARALALTDGGVGAVLDFVGAPASVEQGVSLLRKGGRLVVVGMFGGELTLPIPTLVLRAISIEGSYVGSLAEMRDLMDLVRREGMPALPLTTRPLSEINEAFDAMRAGAVIGRTVLQP
jgi:D-arabinose 1-dehydrogenase-like Zn-dependent alcohol dehydrogenase